MHAGSKLLHRPRLLRLNGYPDNRLFERHSPPGREEVGMISGTRDREPRRGGTRALARDRRGPATESRPRSRSPSSRAVVAWPSQPELRVPWRCLEFSDMIALQLRQRMPISPAAAGLEAILDRVSAASGQRLENST